MLVIRRRRRSITIIKRSAKVNRYSHGGGGGVEE